MIKNLLWKQAMEAAKKKFGNLNTVEANKWLTEQYKILVDKIDTYNKANKKAVEEFKGFKPEVVPKHDPFKNLPNSTTFDQLLELGGKKIKKFDPFKKEGKKIDFGKYYDKRKRGEFDEGGIILPQPKPYNFEEKLDFLREIKGGVGSKFYLQMMSDTLSEGVEKGAISKEERDNFLKRFTGTISEGWTSAIDDENLYLNEGEYERYPPKFNEGGSADEGFINEKKFRKFPKASNIYFQDKFNEFDWGERYINMSPKEGLEQVLQDIKNSNFIKSMKMEEGELGKLPPIPSSILMRLGLGSIIKNMRYKGLYEKLKETPESPLLVSDFKTTVGGTSRRDLLQLLFGKKKKYSKQEIDQLKKLDDSKIRLGKNLEKFWDDLFKHLDNPEKFSKPTMPEYEIDTAEEILKKAIDKKTTFHAEGGLAGMLGETQPQQVGYAEDRKKIIEFLYDKAGGFDGTGKSFEEFMADVIYEGDYIYAKGGRVGLKKGGKMTPSEAWMRAYFFDGKGGYDDSGMTWDFFKKHIGPDLWYKHIGKYAEGGRAGYLKGGLLRTGIMEALDFFTRKGSRQGVDVRETILPADDVGDYAINMGDVRELFKNLDEKFANKITSKESIDEIITRFRDTRKLDLSESIKEFLNNRIKQYKSGLENIKKYGQRGPIEEVGDHAEELRYLIKETRKDLDAINKYEVTQQAKKATKHAEGGIVGLKDGGTLLEKYKEYAPKGPWTKGLTDMEITYELYNLLEPYMSLFMKEGGRVGFSEGKGPKNPGRRKFMKIAAALASMIPGVKWGAKAIKPASKVMDDIKITLRGDGDWEQDIDGLWLGGNWVNYSFEALTDKGRKILAKLSKGKNASLVDKGDGIYHPGTMSDAKTGYFIADEGEYAVDAVDAIKKAKGNISLNMQVGKNVKGAKPEKYKDMDLGYSTKTYGSKEINKKTILDEVDDMFAHDSGGYAKKHFDNESVEDIIDITEAIKKAEGGRVGLWGGGLLNLAKLIWKSKALNKKFFDPKKLADKTDDAGRELRTRNLLGQDKWSDIPKTLKNALYTAVGGTGVASLLKYLEQRLGSVDALKEDNVLQDLVDNEGIFEKAEGGRIGLDAGGPPISPANLHPLQRPMFYQGGLTKTVPPQRGPMPQGLQSDVYDGIMRPGVINGRN